MKKFKEINRLKEASMDSSTFESPAGNQFRQGDSPAARSMIEKPQKEPMKKYKEKVNEMLKPKMSALDKFRQASAERAKKHDTIEREMQARHAAGKEDMSGSIDRLEKSLNKEEVEQIQEYESKSGVYKHKGTYGTSYKGDIDPGNPKSAEDSNHLNKTRTKNLEQGLDVHFGKISKVKEEVELHEDKMMPPVHKKVISKAGNHIGTVYKYDKPNVFGYTYGASYHPHGGRGGASGVEWTHHDNPETAEKTIHRQHGLYKAAATKAVQKAEKHKTSISEETESLEEGRPSQRHPLEGHDYHKKTNAELEYIAKDAHKAAEAMKSHNTTAENKYRDQANDSATVRHFRKTSGTPDWYKKKYNLKEETEMKNDPCWKNYQMVGKKMKNGKEVPNCVPVKEEVEHLNEDETLKAIAKKHDMKYHPGTYGANMSHATKGYVNINRYGEWGHYKQGRFDRGHGLATAHGDSSQHFKDLDKHLATLKEGKFNQMDVDRQDREAAMEKDGWKKTPANVTDKSGAKHSPMSRARDLARLALNKKAKSLSPVREEKEESRKAGIVKNVVKSAKKKKSDSAETEKFESEPVLSSEIQKQ